MSHLHIPVTSPQHVHVHIPSRSGGGISTVGKNTLKIENTSFVSNFATDSGGAISALNDTELTFTHGDDTGATISHDSIKFLENQARLGGAIVWQSSNLWLLENNLTIEFSNNTAAIGSAIAFADVFYHEDRQLHNLEFRNVR